MRTITILALLVTVTLAFNVFRNDENQEDLQLLSTRNIRDTSKKTKESESNSNSSEEEEGSGSGETLKRVAREASGEEPEGSGIFEIASEKVRFVRSADLEGSGSGTDED